MSELSHIPLSRAELQRRIILAANGDSLEKVSDLLGGPPYKSEVEGKKLRTFWRFYIPENNGLSEPYEIYMGEFVNGQLVFGFILPHGSSAKGEGDTGFGN